MKDYVKFDLFHQNFFSIMEIVIVRGNSEFVSGNLIRKYSSRNQVLNKFMATVHLLRHIIYLYYLSYYFTFHLHLRNHYRYK